METYPGFESRWCTFTKKEEQDGTHKRPLSFFDDVEASVLFMALGFCFFCTFHVISCVYDYDNEIAVEKHERGVAAHQVYKSNYAHDVEFWHVMNTGECTQSVEVQTFCVGMKELRRLSLDENIRSTMAYGSHGIQIDSPDWQAFLKLKDMFGPKISVYSPEELVQVVRKGPQPLLTHPDTFISVEPVADLLDVPLTLLLLWVLFGICTSFIAGIFLDEDRLYYAFTRHTYVSRVFGFLFVLLWMLIWLVRGAVNVWDYCWWRFRRMQFHVAQQTAIAESVLEKERAYKEAIDRLDGDLRANYDAILHAQQEIESLIRQAPNEDVEVKATMQAQLADLKEQVLTLHEFQDARDQAKRQRKLLEIASKIEEIVAGVKGRMGVAAEATELETERIA